MNGMSTQSPSKRLAIRRGSVSAQDPLGKNTALNHDPNRSSSSTLTIVRVVDPASISGSVAPLNLSDSSSAPTHTRRSLRRNGSTSGPSSVDNRLSFAFSSFSPVSPPQPSSPLIPSGPQNYPSRAGYSPSSSPRLRPSSPQFTRRHSASGGSAFSKPHLTPEQLVDLARQSSLPRYVSGTTVTSNTSNSSNSDATLSSISPATFTLLDDDVYLPFVDRAAETAHLLSIPPTKKLFSLLAQTFPTQTPRDERQDPFIVDPAQWTFNTLRQWLTEVDRSSASDTVWVRKARRCVLAHSELIWERLKGALGVPPELESEDLDSCHFIDSADNLHDVPFPQEDEHNSDIIDNSLHSSDPVNLTSSPEQSLIIEPILATSSSNPSPPTSGVSNPPPSSLPAGLSQSTSKSQADQILQDIAEDREEEDEPGIDTSDKDPIKAEGGPKAQIHGLRVCTSQVPSSSATAPQVLSSYPPSPAISMNVSGRNSVEPRSPDFSLSPLTRRLSRSSSRGSIASTGWPVSGSYSYRDFIYNGASSEIGDSESERAYDPVGDRVPGNPLFPSNFARLALGPTLRANNPSLRSSNATTPRWTRWAPGSRPPSWFEGWDAAKEEYAATVASGSSIGAGD